MFDGDEAYLRALDGHRKYEARRKKASDDQLALLILMTILVAGSTVFGVAAILYIAGGMKLVAQLACLAGLVAIALVYAHRYIMAHL